MKHWRIIVNEFETASEAIEAAVKSGYSHSFKVEDGRLRCIETDERFDPGEVVIVNHHRFEGASSEDDSAVVYVVECGTRTKGTIVDAYGTYSDAALAAFLKRVPIKES
jgi:hypothetical protein